MVVERRAVPGVKRPASQATVAPRQVVAARCRIWRRSGSPSRAVTSGSAVSGAVPGSSPGICSFGVTATAIAGNRSVNRFTSSI